MTQQDLSSRQVQAFEPGLGSECSGQTGVDVPFTASRPKSLMGNGSWSVALTIWQIVVTFLLTRFLIDSLGTSNYGLFMLLMSISGMMGLMNLGLGEATLRYVAYYYGRSDMAGINRVVGATFAIYLMSGLAGWAALFFGASPIAGLLSLPPGDQQLAVSLLRLTAIAFGISFITGAFTSIPQAMQRFDISTKLSIAQSVFQVSGTVAILLYGGGIYQLVLWSVATAVFTQTLSMIVVKRLLPALSMRPSLTRAGLKEVFKYGVWSLITQLFGTIWFYGDGLLLGVLVNMDSVCYLTVPKNLNFKALDLVASAGSGLFPRFSTLTDPAARARLFLNATWVMLLCSVVIYVPLTVMLPDFLRLWINPKFALASAFVGQLIAASCLIRGAANVYQPLFKGINKPHILSIVTVVSSAISLAVNVTLIPWLGLAGAGYSFVATAGLGMIMVVYAWRKSLGMPSSKPLLRAMALPVGMGFLTLAVSVWIHSLLPPVGWFGLIALGVGFTLLAGGAVTASELLWGGENHALVLLRRLRGIVLARAMKPQ